MPKMVFPKVDLPQPLSPTRPKISPDGTAKLTPSTALIQPTTRLNTPRVMGKYFLSSLTSRSGSMSRVMFYEPWAWRARAGTDGNAPNDREKAPAAPAVPVGTRAWRPDSACGNDSPGAA